MKSDVEIKKFKKRRDDERKRKEIKGKQMKARSDKLILTKIMEGTCKNNFEFHQKSHSVQMRQCIIQSFAIKHRRTLISKFLM